MILSRPTSLRRLTSTVSIKLSAIVLLQLTALGGCKSTASSQHSDLRDTESPVVTYPVLKDESVSIGFETDTRKTLQTLGMAKKGDCMMIHQYQTSGGELFYEFSCYARNGDWCEKFGKNEKPAFKLRTGIINPREFPSTQPINAKVFLVDDPSHTQVGMAFIDQSERNMRESAIIDLCLLNYKNNCKIIFTDKGLIQEVKLTR